MCGGVVLMVGHVPHAIRSTLFPIADALVDRGCAVEFAVDGEHSAKTIELLRCRQESIRITDRPAPRSFASRLTSWLAKIPIVGPYFSFRRELLSRCEVLRDVGAVGLVLLDDRTVLACKWIAAAARSGVPSVVVQWANTLPSDAMVAIRSISHQGQRHAAFANPVRWLARTLSPENYRFDSDGNCVPFFTDRMAIVMKANRAMPPDPWSFGGGRSTRVCFRGEHWKRQSERSRDEVDDSHLVTGHPVDDLSYQLRLQKELIRATVRQQLRVPEETKLVTFLAPALSFRESSGVRPDLLADDVLADLASIVRVTRESDRSARFVIKVHPRDFGKSRYESLREFCDGLVLVEDEIETENLIAASDLTISGWSTTVLAALAMGVPVVLYDFHRSPSASVFNDVDGPIDRCGSIEEFAAVATRRLNDEPMPEGAVGQDLLLISTDGNATRRIVDEVLRLNPQQH